MQKPIMLGAVAYDPKVIPMRARDKNHPAPLVRQPFGRAGAKA